MREFERRIELYGSKEHGYEEIKEYFSLDVEMLEEIEEYEKKEYDIKLNILISDSEKIVDWTILIRAPGEIDFTEVGTEEDDYKAVLEAAKENSWEILDNE